MYSFTTASILLVCFMGLIGLAELGEDFFDELWKIKTKVITNKKQNSNQNEVKVEEIDHEKNENEKRTNLKQKVKKETEFGDEKVDLEKYAKKKPISANEKEEKMPRECAEENIVPTYSSEEEMENKSGKFKSLNFGKDWKRADKMAIINQFISMRNEYKQRSDYRHEDCATIEQKIANELEIPRKRIYQWRRELGLIKQTNEPNEETKKALITKFENMRREYKQRSDYRFQDYARIEQNIVNELGISRRRIYQWKREMTKELGNRRKFSDEKRQEIIAKFDIIKGEISSKFKIKITKEIANKIARKFAISAKTIRAWKNKLQRKHYGIGEENWHN